MFNSTVLEVAIGLAFSYLLLALICTTVNEWLAGITKLRGKMLAKGIQVLLKGQTLGAGGEQFLDRFMAHPLVRSLQSDPKTPPSYMPSRTFALTVFDLLTPEQPGPITFQELQDGINNLPPGTVKATLLSLIQNVHGDLAQAQAQIEAWFNNSMDRVSGWYTRNRQFTSCVIAVVLVIVANADTLSVANRLWASPTLRQEVVARAQSSQGDTEKTAGTGLTLAEKLQSELGDLAGWSSDWKSCGGKIPELAGMVVYHIPGWLLTMVAVSLGSPFWFDTLNRFMSVRAGGKPPAPAQQPQDAKPQG